MCALTCGPNIDCARASGQAKFGGKTQDGDPFPAQTGPLMFLPHAALMGWPNGVRDAPVYSTVRISGKRPLRLGSRQQTAAAVSLSTGALVWCLPR